MVGRVRPRQPARSELLHGVCAELATFSQVGRCLHRRSNTPRTIEDVPLPDGSIDVVISNCVINLSVDKPKVIAEMFRVLAPGGRIGISDVVAEDHLTPAERAERRSYVGCIPGALSRSEAIAGLAAVGFDSLSVRFTQQVADGMHNAIIQATKPGGDTRTGAAGPQDIAIEASAAGETGPTVCCHQATSTACCSIDAKASCCGDPAARPAGQLRLPMTAREQRGSGPTIGWRRRRCTRCRRCSPLQSDPDQATVGQLAMCWRRGRRSPGR